MRPASLKIGGIVGLGLDSLCAFWQAGGGDGGAFIAGAA